MKNYLERRNNNLGFNLFDDLFEDFFKPTFFSGGIDSMRTDVIKKEEGYELVVDVPGFEKEDVNLSLEGGYLTISANKEEKESDDNAFVRRERKCSIKRSYYVGDKITEDDIKATLVNGTLKVDVKNAKQDKLEKKNIAID